MGSLFLIVVPIRSYELKLRLIENDILTSQAYPVSAPEVDTHEVLKKTMRKLDADTLSVDSNQELLAKDIQLPPTKDIVMSYNLIKPGKGQLLLQLTRDCMKLIRADAIQTETRAKRPSIKTSAEMIALRDSDEEEITASRLKMNVSRENIESMDDLTITELIDSKFLERHMEDVLQKFELLHCSYETSIDGKFSRICYSVSEARADKIISHLHAIGIGKKYESTLSVCATSVFTQEKQRKKSVAIGESSGSDEEEKQQKEGQWKSFVQSIKARITVAQVVENVKANAVLTFDFLIMLIVAGIIAAIGLLDNSPVNLIASMLVSPLMGPIMAFTFGAMIRDKRLIKTGVVSEVNGLLLCVLVGLLFGIFLEWSLFDGPWAKVEKWPTEEMATRGRMMALVVGAAIAIPSGAGVALSILAGNAGSLVGVAISASLLPPCVNCGIFYGLALVIMIKEAYKGKNPFRSCNETLSDANATSTDYLIRHNKMYCSNPMHEYAAMGTVSLGLTLLNIILIFLTGLICLKIKEVAPYTSKTAFERFWKHDVKHARDYNLAHGQEGKDALLNDIVDDPKLLGAVEEDFVFNQVKNRAMYREENVITQAKEKKSKAALKRQEDEKSWFGGMFSSKAETHKQDVVTKAKQSFKGQK